jgi:hypothetical protein
LRDTVKLEIRQTGIGANGQPVLFNRKPRRASPPKAKALHRSAAKLTPDLAELLAALKSLGLVTTAQAVTDALAALFPEGHAELDPGDVIRKVFLHLQSKKK